MQIERTDPSKLVVNGLPDGSKVIVDPANERIYALNPTAGAAWDACQHETTLAEVVEEMRRSFGPSVTNEVAEQAIARLQEENLVRATGLLRNASRRQVLAGIAAIALPLVVSMTMTEQKAFAQVANSGQHPPSDPPSNGWNGWNNGSNDWNSHHPEAHVSHKSNGRL
jgi:hypothetical protein